MRKMLAIGGVIVSWFLALHLTAPQRAPAQIPGAAGAPDAHGDPLPSPVVFKRFGTVRFRHGSRILCVAFSPDGKWIAAAGGDDPIRLWEAQTGKEIRQFPDVWVHALAFTPDSKSLAAGGGFKTIRLWSVDTGKELRALKGHTGAVNALAFSTDGKSLLSGSQDRIARLWDVDTGNCVKEYRGHKDEITAIALRRDGKQIVTGGADRTLLVRNEFKEDDPVVLPAACQVTAVAYGSDGAVIASAGDDHIIRLWDSKSGKELGQLRGHQETVVSLCFSRDGKTLYSGSRDGAIRRWDIVKRVQTLSIAHHPGDADALALSPDGSRLATGGRNNTVRVLDAATGKEVVSHTGHQGGICTLAISPNGKLLATSCWASTARVWDIASGKELRRWASGRHGETALAFSPDSKWLATAGPGEPVRIWNIATGAEVRKFVGTDSEGILCLAFAPNGKSLALGSRGEEVRLLEIETGKPRLVFKYAGGVHALAFSLDGKLLAAAGPHKIKASVWALATGDLVGEFGQTSPIASLAFAPDGKTLAAGNYDATIHLWDLYDKNKKEPRILEGHTSAVFSIGFSASGRVLVSGSFDKTVRLWEVGNGQPIASWPGHQGAVTAVAISPLGRYVVSGSADTAVLFWDITGRMKEEKIAAVAFQPGQLSELWKDLASDDNPKANRALWTMVAGGKEAVEFLDKSVYLIDPEKIRQFVHDLDSNKFVVREKATVALEKYGRWIEGILLETQKNPPSYEVRCRVDRLLEKIRVPGSITIEQERLRVRRIIDILEQTGDPLSRQVLQNLAQGAAEDALRSDAAAALQRLSHRKS